MRTRLFFKIAMQGIFTRTFALLSLVILSIISFAQDTTVYKWKYKSKKIGDRKYELIFTTDSVNGWQLYAPNQDLGGVQTVELKLADSAIAVDKEFKVDGPSKTFISPIFADTVRVYEQKAEWKATISFIDTVPAKLPGKLTYFFGKDDAFNSELLDFSVDLEGGVETITVVDIPTIDIENPVMPCGDDGTGNKSILSIFFSGFGGRFDRFAHTLCVSNDTGYSFFFYKKITCEEEGNNECDPLWVVHFPDLCGHHHSISCGRQNDKPGDI